MKKNRAFIPAFHFHALTRWYDPVVRALFPESTIKSALIAQACLQPGQMVLDVGCGTGTLTLLIKQTQPEVIVHGIDIDTEILQIAQNKADAIGLDLKFQQGSATCLPYPDQSFDHVFTSLMMHHLITVDKQHMLQEVFRVLKSGGKLQVADFSTPHTPVMWIISLLVRWLEEVHDNVLGLLPVFMRNVGFESVRATKHFRSLFGTVALYEAIKPAMITHVK